MASHKFQMSVINLNISDRIFKLLLKNSTKQISMKIYETEAFINALKIKFRNILEFCLTQAIRRVVEITFCVHALVSESFPVAANNGKF